jgi:AcrR family transcriptional regulator
MPRAVDVEERRQSITEATARLIARGGLGAATMRDIATEAGWTTGVVTHYFTDKRELLLRTLQASLDQRQAARQAETEAGGLEALAVALRTALPIGDEGRRHWLVTLAFCSEAASDDELAAVQRGAYRGFRAHVASLIEDCSAARGSEAVRLAERLIAQVDGIALQALFDEESWPASRQLAALDEALAMLSGPTVATAPADE